MDIKKLEGVAASLLTGGKGILAADESNATMDKRLETVSVAADEETRRLFRNLLFTAPDIEKYVSGIILFDETMRQKGDDGQTFPALLLSRGIAVGIKVDRGTVPLPFFEGEKITEGLDGLRERLEEYRQLGATFAKWRAVFSLGDGLPSDTCISANTHGLCRYGALCQEEGIVPILEPEVLLDGEHSLHDCREATARVLTEVFRVAAGYQVVPSAMILKIHMVLPGAQSQEKVDEETIARETIETLVQNIPSDIAGVVFLSGGQGSPEATERLNAIAKEEHPWPLTFSYSRAIEEPVLAAWQGKEENVEKAHEVLLERLRANSLAAEGKYRSVHGV